MRAPTAVKALVAMRRATELVLKESKGNKELVTCMTDATALAIQGQHAATSYEEGDEQGLRGLGQ